jgi:hypothetical protein
MGVIPPLPIWLVRGTKLPPPQGDFQTTPGSVMMSLTEGQSGFPAFGLPWKADDGFGPCLALVWTAKRDDTRH